jgi:hypothetical protein
MRRWISEASATARSAKSKSVPLVSGEADATVGCGGAVAGAEIKEEAAAFLDQL